MRRDQLPSERKRTYVLPKYKVVYVSTPKAACTSMKWVIAGLAGEDAKRFAEVIRPGTTPTNTIHPRRFWQRTPRLHDLSDEQLAEIDEANGWHIFAMVRHPTMRLWSAWQEKLLLREPHVAGKVPDDLVPPLPHCTSDVVEAFQKFVARMGDVSTGELMRDPHFVPQYDVLAANRMPYTRVYTTREMDHAMRDLEDQVRANGGSSIPTLLSLNETPLKPLRSVFTHEVLAKICATYESDFRTWFRDADPVPPGTLYDNEYASTLFAEVDRLVERHARIGQLATLAERLQAENESLRHEVARLQKEKNARHGGSGTAVAGRQVSRAKTSGMPNSPLSRPLDLVLHIGMGKTGTSSIQFLLRDNRKQLSELGILFPTTPGVSRHDRLALFAKPDQEVRESPEWARQKQSDPARFRNAFRRRLFSEIEESGLSRVLLSDEILFGATEPTLRRLHRFTDGIAQSLRVVAYLRRQDEHMVSRYQEGVKIGWVMRLTEWAQEDMSDLYDYYARLRRHEQLLCPTELIVRRYERASFVGGSLYQDFLDAAGIDVKADDLVQGPSRNHTLDVESVEFLRLLNLYRVENDGAVPGLIDNRKLVARLKAVSSGPALSLPASWMDRFMAQWDETNALTARRFLEDPSGQLFRMPRKSDNTTTEQRLDPSRLDHFLALLELPEEMHAPLRRVVEREARKSTDAQIADWSGPRPDRGGRWRRLTAARRGEPGGVSSRPVWRRRT